MLQSGKSRVQLSMRSLGFSNLPNPSSRTMALGSTQSRTELSARSLPGGKGRPARKADNLTTVCEPIVYKMWDMACYRDSSAYFNSLYYE
jgi:hypothetical protein